MALSMSSPEILGGYRHPGPRTGWARVIGVQFQSALGFLLRLAFVAKERGPRVFDRGIEPVRAAEIVVAMRIARVTAQVPIADTRTKRRRQIAATKPVFAASATAAGIGGACHGVARLRRRALLRLGTTRLSTALSRTCSISFSRGAQGKRGR